MDAPAPAAGIRVLDLSTTLPGPYCTQLLADLGAEVVKVERPDGGDYLRELMPAMFAAFNRGKGSVAIDLKDEAARERFYALLAQADVVVEGFRPGVAARLGVDAETVRARNPRIVYCSISGAGQTGPLARRPGHDANYLGLSGALTTPDGPTEVPWLPYADLGAGALGAVAILAALLRRTETGLGATIDLGMLDVCVTWALSRHAGGGDEANVSPAHTVLVGSDGRAFTLGAIEDHFWTRFCDVAGEPRLRDTRFLAHEGRARHRGQLAALLREVAATRPAAEWVEACTEADVPALPVPASFAEVLADEQVRARGILGAAFPALVDGAVWSAGSEAPELDRDRARVEHLP
jgi:crotonobetainyl-CoA:carnitine CoA-transferase CaiB-like acyl-CoA transferase